MSEDQLPIQAPDEISEPATNPAPQKSSNTKWFLLIGGGGCALLACAVLAVLLAARFLGPQVSGPVSQIKAVVAGTPTVPAPLAAGVNTPPPRTHPNANANAMGDPNAPVKIVEYADFQCPYCLRYWQDTEPQIIQDYIATGKVYYEYHSVGAFIGPESAAAAQAAYCAGDQDKFWEYHDTLFANWTGENAGDFTPDKLDQYAQAVGMNLSQFDVCIRNGNHADQVQQDVVDAQSNGIQATPSFLINGQLLEGAQPYQVFQKAIDAALKTY